MERLLGQFTIHPPILITDIRTSGSSGGISLDINWYLDVPTLAALLWISISCRLLANIRHKGRFVDTMQHVVLPVGGIIGLYQLMNALICYSSPLELIICLEASIQPFLYACIIYVVLTVLKVHKKSGA